MDFTIFLISSIAGFSYALQGTLLSKYARKFDGFTSSLFRNTSFIVTMSPLLFIAGWDGISSVSDSWHYILFSGIFGFISLPFIFNAHKYLPVGIANGVGQISPLFILLWGFIFLDQSIHWYQGVFVSFVLLGLIILNSGGFSEMKHLKDDSKKGFLYALLGVLFGSICVFLMVMAVQVSDPFAVAYFWESTIGVFFLFTFFIRTKILKHTIPLPSKKEIFQIALASSPTVVGSSLLPLAMSMGIAGLISTNVSAVAAVSAIVLSYFLYKEKLKKKHFFGIFCIVLGIGLLKSFDIFL